MSNWKQTPTLDAFAAMYDADEHLWWRIECVADGNWKGLATSSATWLRSLTDGGAA
jgi:hypothetical protein